MVILWQEAECDTDSLPSHPAPCHLVRELYKDHLDPGVVSKKKESGSGDLMRISWGSQGANQRVWVLDLCTKGPSLCFQEWHPQCHQGLGEGTTQY